MKSCVLLLCLFCATPLPASAEPLVIIGPFGVPIQVQDEFGNWSIPIKVYSDRDADMFVPDITSMGWKSWHAGRFRQEGVYVVQLLIFLKNSNYCMAGLLPTQRAKHDFAEACGELRYMSESLVVNTRQMTVYTAMRSWTGEDARFHPDLQTSPKTTKSLSDMNRAQHRAIDTVSGIVKDEISRYTGRLSP